MVLRKMTHNMLDLHFKEEKIPNKYECKWYSRALVLYDILEKQEANS